MAANDKSGKTVSSQAAYSRALLRQAETLLSFEELWDHLDSQGFTITQLRIKHPGVLGGEYQLIVKARSVEGDVVAFHNAGSLSELLVGFVNRLHNRTIKFREDRPYGG